MELEVHLANGESFRIYERKAETPEQAVALLRAHARHRLDWLQLGDVVVWSGDITFVRCVDPADTANATQEEA